MVQLTAAAALLTLAQIVLYSTPAFARPIDPTGLEGRASALGESKVEEYHQAPNKRSLYKLLGNPILRKAMLHPTVRKAALGAAKKFTGASKKQTRSVE